MVNIKKFNKKLSLKSISRKHKGFSLLELILVLGISTLVGISMIQYESRRSAIIKAENAGAQLNIVGKALTSYISREVIILSTLPNNVAVDLPFDVLRGKNEPNPFSTDPAKPNFLGHEILPTSFQPRSSFGPTFRLQVRKKDDKVEGLVITDRPICEKDNVAACGSSGNPIKYDWIGAAMKKIGPYGGLTYNQANTMTGYNAGWQEINSGATGFTAINTAGLIGYRVFGTAVGDFDNIYLRLDGTSTMRGNLNMGNHNLNNATNINYSGWLIGNNAALNLIRSANIYNSGNLETANAYATNDVNVGNDVNVLNDVNVGNDVKVGRNVYVNNNLIVNRETTLGQNLTDYTYIMGESLHKENSFFEKNVKVDKALKVEQRIGAGHISTNNILFSDYHSKNPWETLSLPAKADPGRVIPQDMWLTDMIPRYSSRGIEYVRHGSTVAKPACYGGPGNARVEVIPQNVSTQGRVFGNLELRKTFDGGGVVPDEYKIMQDQFSQGGFTVSASNNGSSWTVNIFVSTYNAGLLPATAQTMLAHTYCDLGF